MATKLTHRHRLALMTNINMIYEVSFQLEDSNLLENTAKLEAKTRFSMFYDHMSQYDETEAKEFVISYVKENEKLREAFMDVILAKCEELTCTDKTSTAELDIKSKCIEAVEHNSRCVINTHNLLNF